MTSQPKRRGTKLGVAPGLGRSAPVTVEAPSDIRVSPGELLVGDGQQGTCEAGTALPNPRGGEIVRIGSWSMAPSRSYDRVRDPAGKVARKRCIADEFYDHALM